MLNKALQYLVSMGLIFGCLFAGNSLQSFFDLSIPGSILGMLMLFLLLATGIVPVRWVKPSASLFIRFLVLLFVPISVGLMQHFDVLIHNALPILASTIGGTFIVLVCLSLLIDRSLKKES